VWHQTTIEVPEVGWEPEWEAVYRPEWTIKPCPGGQCHTYVSLGPSFFAPDNEYAHDSQGNQVSGIHGQGAIYWMTYSVSNPDCPGDVNFSGRVDVNDILALIHNWGKQTIDAGLDPSGDWKVGIEDLVEVINGWGMTCET
jgi:hypothetical protein